MIYVKADRKILVAMSWKEMVRQLHAISFDSADNKKDYMFNVAARVKQMYDEYVENYRYEGFVRALSKLGIITLFKCSECDHFCMRIHSDEYYCSKGIKTDFNPRKVDCPFMTNKLILKLQMILFPRNTRTNLKLRRHVRKNRLHKKPITQKGGSNDSQ